MRSGTGKVLAALWLIGAAPLAAAPGTQVPVAAEVEAPAKRAPVAQDYTPRPALWLLSDEDTKIYLFGTIHVLPPGFKWRSPALDQAAKEADELVVETADDPGSDDDAALLVSVMLDKPAPILERVPADKRPALLAAIGKSGVPVEVLEMMRTWTVAMMLGLVDTLNSWGVDDPSEAPGVEHVLEAEFRTAGKPILSVETPEAALESLNALPEADQVALLLETLAEPAQGEDAGDAPDDRLWATGRPEEAYAIFLKDMPPLLYDGLVRKRNAAWVLWLEERLKRPGTVLFAVGTGHLAGPDSVQKMLAARGLDAKRVD